MKSNVFFLGFIHSVVIGIIPQGVYSLFFSNNSDLEHSGKVIPLLLTERSPRDRATALRDFRS